MFVSATQLRPRLEVRFASDFVIRFPVELLARRAAVCRRQCHVFTSRHTTGVAHGTEAHEAKGASSPIAIASFAGVPRLITPFAIFRAPTGQQALAAPDQRFAIAAAPAAAPASATPVQTPHCRTTVARPGT